MYRTCFICSARKIAVDPVHQQAGKGDNRIQRRPKFVRDIGKEFGLQLRCAPQIVGALVQFRIERDDAAVGIFEFPVEQLQFFLARAQFLKRLQQFLILLFDLLVRTFGRSRLHLAAEIMRSAQRPGIPMMRKNACPCAPLFHWAMSQCENHPSDAACR